VNQRVNGGNWFSLGTFYFTADGTEDVTLSDKADSYVIADAVWFLDRTPPVITNLQYKDVTLSTITISWETNEEADSVIRFGTASGNYTILKPDEAKVLFHELSLIALDSGTTYYFIIEGTDDYGNTGVSQEYSFTTSGAMLLWTAEQGFTDGVSNCKWSCKDKCTVEFKVIYINEVDGTCPTENDKKEIWIDLNNNDKYDGGNESFTMDEADTGDIDCRDGKTYTYTPSSHEIYLKGITKYRFSFTIGISVVRGEPTKDHIYVNNIDSDGDGVFDSEERDGDIDRDGISNCEDSDTAMLSVSGGKEITLDISSSGTTFSGVSALSVDDPSIPPGRPNVDFYFGLVGFTIKGFNPGDGVPVRITYPEPIPPNAEYWKFNPNNRIWYSIGFSSVDDKTITFILIDGGQGDSDNDANGTIVDPGGIGFSSSDKVEEDVGIRSRPDSVGGCFIGTAVWR
jgi:hypothetical protein